SRRSTRCEHRLRDRIDSPAINDSEARCLLRTQKNVSTIQRRACANPGGLSVLIVDSEFLVTQVGWESVLHIGIAGCVPVRAEDEAASEVGVLEAMRITGDRRKSDHRLPQEEEEREN